jgi:nucleoside-diphosphate kinase
MIERTLALIKPEAVHSKNIGKIVDLIEQNGFEILCMEKVQLTRAMAEQFYGVHKAKPFFGELVSNITNGPLIAMALQKENGIASWRNLMGATDPVKAEAGTIRKLFGKDISFNAVHGSDAPETAAFEVKLFFPKLPAAVQGNCSCPH